MNATTTSLLLKAAAVLWVIWGLVHVLAGFLIIIPDTPDAVANVADAVDRSLLVGPYHDAVGAIVNQHGWNLLWIGAFTTIGAYFVWRASVIGMFMTGLIGGLADIGYFVFLDLGGFVNFMPGGLMTVVSATAIILSAIAYFGGIRGKSA